MNHSVFTRGRQVRPLLLALLSATAAIAQIVTPISDGGTGAGDAATARTNLGLGTGNSPQFANLTLTGNLTVSGAGTHGFAGRVAVADGSAGSPSLHFTADPDTGIARAATDSLEIATGGVRSALFTATAVSVTGNITTSGTNHAFGAAGGASNIVNLNGGGGTFKFLGFNTGGLARWIMGVPGEVEAGSNAGSPFRLSAFTDGGATIDNPISIVRAAGGALTLARPTYAMGTTTNDNAATGYIGEYVSGTVSSGSAVTLTTATATNVSSISLTAGDWDVTFNGFFDLAGATVTTKQIGVTNTSLTFGGLDSYTYERGTYTGITGADGLCSPPLRVSLAATTTIYAVVKADFSAGTVKAYGTLRARRVR